VQSSWLMAARKQKGWTQQQAAARFGVSQTYWSLLEHGRRPMSLRLIGRLRRHFEVPATLAPLQGVGTGPRTAKALTAALAGLGYPGFSYVRGRRPVNPASVLFVALRHADLDTRVVEALPWLAWQHADLDWDWLIDRAKVADLQNRLGFVVCLGKQVATRKGDDAAVAVLAGVEARLERSRLVRDDTLCRESMPTAERRWLTTARSPDAAHWNLFSDLEADHLPYAA
jgi:transcriptional regulator with XRE-family HTH domain